jgi:choice-of-anchor B domain-containing protein
MKKRYIALLLMCINAVVAHAQSPISMQMTLRDTLQFSGNSSIASVWGYVDEQDNEYAIVGTNTGMTIANVNNPDSIYKIASFVGATSIWREVKAYKNYAYAVTEGGGGLMMVDLSPLPQSNVLPMSFFSFSNTGRAHTLFIDENGILYLFGCNGAISNGAMMYDLDSIPGTPVYLGSYNNATDSYIHDGYVRGDTLYGGHIYGGFFSVADVSNKQAPVTLATQSTPNLFTHNTWLSPNGKTLFTTDEKDFSYVAAYDISNLSNITEIDRLHVPYGDSISIPHNVYVKNNYIYTAWYKEGILVHDATNPNQLVLVGYYDTDQLTMGGLFNKYRGAWGAYPYLPSGNILVSDILNGLFVITPNYQPAAYLKGKVTLSNGSPVSGALVQIQGSNPISTVITDTNGDYMIGIAAGGAYAVNYSRVGYTTQTSNINFVNANTITQNIVLNTVSTQDINFVNASLAPSIGTYTTLNHNFYTTIQAAQVLIMDITGKIVHQQNLNTQNTSTQLNPENLSNGVYFVQITQQNRKTAPLKWVKMN